MKRSSRRISVALRILLGLVLVGVILARVDMGEMSIELNRSSIVGGVVACALLVTCLALSAVRWRLVLGPVGLSTAYLCRLYLISWFFSLFLPTSVGGDAVRMMAVTQSNARPGLAVSSIVAERLLGVLSLGCYLLLGLILAPGVVAQAVGATEWSVPAWLLLVAVPLCGVVGWVAYRFIRRTPALARFASDAQVIWDRFRSSPARLVSALLVSLLVQGGYILMWLALARGLNLAVPAVMLLVFVPFISLVSMLPVSISGLGIREGTWVVLLAPVGVVAANAVGFSLFYYICGLAVGLLGGALFIFSGITLKTLERHDEHYRRAVDVPAR